MIIVKLIGGLGNQMFQYAMGRRIACMNNTDLKLDITGFKNSEGTTPRKYELNHFNIIENIALEKDIAQFKNKSRFVKLLFKIIDKFKPYYKRSIVREQFFFQFEPNILKIGNHVYLEGYWQSEKYFKDIEDIIRKEFTLKFSLDHRTNNLLRIIMKNNSIGLHIRRGDYITNPIANKVLGFLGIDYYTECIKLITDKVKDPYFFIFTDDYPWVKKNLTVKHQTLFVSESDRSEAFKELYLMSKCKHNIIANSSFSWWAAWLNVNPNKLIFAPKKWSGSKNPYYNTQDLIPYNWYKI